MKVIHLISGGDTGGAKTHVLSLLHGLLGQAELTLVCFTNGPFAQEARELGIPIIVLPGRNFFRTLRALKKMILTGSYDIIHCHGARGNLMGALLRSMTGLPAVSTVHSDYRLDYMGRPLARLTYGWLNAAALHALDYRIGVSDAMADTLLSRGFDPDRLFTIYNGLDFTPRPVPVERTEFFRSVGLQADEHSVVVGIAARLDPVKDLPTLIRAFAKAHTQQPGLRLLIAGDGPQMDELRLLAKALGVAGSVVFAGWLSDMDSFYHAIDINTLTSLSETFPYSLTEGARAARPTIASRVGGVPDLIDHGVNGLLFEAGNVDALAGHITALAADPELRAQYGHRLYETAREKYSIETTIRRQLEIYRAILRKQARPKRKRDGVLICGAYGRENAGDEAILASILTDLRSIDRDLPVRVMSHDPKGTRLAYRVNSIHTFSLFRFLRCAGKARLFLHGGGSLLQDATSRRSLWFYLFTLWYAKRRGCKVLMYGCGVGPIHSPFDRWLTARVLQNCADAITLRDPHSKTELENMRITKPQVILSADPAVCLSAPNSEAVDDLMKRCGLDPSGSYLGLTLRPWPGFEKAAPAFGALADYAWVTYGLEAVFLPIEPDPDTEAARLAAAHIKKAPCHIVEHISSAAHAIGLFSRMRAVLSMRLHALIFAAGQGVPMIGVAYDPKVSSFLSCIGQAPCCGLSDVTPEILCAYLDAALARAGGS